MKQYQLRLNDLTRLEFRSGPYEMRCYIWPLQPSKFRHKSFHFAKIQVNPLAENCFALSPFFSILGPAQCVIWIHK